MAFCGPEGGQVREDDVQTWHFAVGCGMERFVLPDIQPHGLGFLGVPREGGTEESLQVSDSEMGFIFPSVPSVLRQGI